MAHLCSSACLVVLLVLSIACGGQSMQAPVAERGMGAPALNGLHYSLAFHFVFPDLADTYDLPLVPFLLTGVIGRRELNREDWVHPNASGAERIAETIWPVLEPMLTETGAARPPDANREPGIWDRSSGIGDHRR